MLWFLCSGDVCIFLDATKGRVFSMCSEETGEEDRWLSFMYWKENSEVYILPAAGDIPGIILEMLFKTKIFKMKKVDFFFLAYTMALGILYI